MKQFIYILMLVVAFSCSNREVKKHYENADLIESPELYEYTTSSTNKYLTIASQKLQDYSELLKLEKKHPELTTDIYDQLQRLSETKVIAIDTKFTIEEIQQIGETERLSDSVQKIKLNYKLVSETENKEDVITAFIKTTTIVLDGKNITSNKITFSKK